MKVIFFIWISISSFLYSSNSYQLPQYVLDDLNKIEFSYDLLDIISDSIFVSWDNYREIPIRIRYENGLQLLINFPELQGDYFLYEKLTIGDKKIFVDTSNVSNLSLNGYFRIGGGASPIGKINQKRVWGLNLRSNRIFNIEKQKELSNSLEIQITTIIHELVHAYQNELGLQFRATNFFYDPNLEFATNSTLEGLALKNAFLAKNKQERNVYLKEFISIRKANNLLLDSLESKNQSNNEFLEGLADYARYRTFEILERKLNLIETIKKKHNLPKSLFYNTTELKEFLFELFEERIYDSYDVVSKVYSYGLYQALLCERTVGTTSQWIKNKDYRYFDNILASKFNSHRIETLYKDSVKNSTKYKEIKHHHALKINKRDSVVSLINTQEGQFYSINFKPIRKTVISLVDYDLPRYRFERNYYFSKSTGPLEIDKIKVLLKTNLAKIENIYELKLVDPSSDKFTLEYSSLGANSVYSNVKIITSVFELYAPKVKIIDDGNIIIIKLLSKM